MSAARFICGDVLEVLPTLPADSADLIVADPPYHRTKAEWWDRQWKTDAAYLEWVGRLCDGWRRVLKPNGSLYVFASPKMAAKVECEIGKWFNLLSSIVWVKPDPSSSINYGAAGGGRQCKEKLRAWWPQTERILFAEHYGADNIAKGEAGYAAKCDELRGFIFEPLRAYLDGERERAGVSVRQVAEAFQRKTGSRTVTGMAGHWFGQVQWALPTRENYEWLRETLASLNHNGEYLRRDYEDLRRDYEDLRRDYEDLRRPFSVSADVPYTDVWDFPTVQHYPGKHPCEKPAALLAHIVKASSRPNAAVLDCFAGSGTLAEVCRDLGRQYTGIEIDPTWVQKAEQRLAAVDAPLFASLESA